MCPFEVGTCAFEFIFRTFVVFFRTNDMEVDRIWSLRRQLYLIRKRANGAHPSQPGATPQVTSTNSMRAESPNHDHAAIIQNIHSDATTLTQRWRGPPALLISFRAGTWGVAPCWDERAPLALLSPRGTRTVHRGLKAHDMTDWGEAPGQRPRTNPSALKGRDIGKEML